MRSLVAAGLLFAGWPAWGEATSDIVVTGVREAPVGGAASKTGTDPRDVPAAVVVVPRALLRSQDVRDLDRALANASAVAPAYGGGYGLADNYVVRGLPMRFLRDGLPDGPTFVGYHRTLADVAALEVLKGPGSALYGRAEAGGSVNLDTLAPETARQARLTLTGARFGGFAASGDVTGAIARGVAGRLIANVERTDGYRGLRRRFVDVLPTLRWSDGTGAITLDYDHREQRQVVDNYGQPFTTGRTLAAVDPTARFYSPFNLADQRIDRVTLAAQTSPTPTLTLRAAAVYDHRRLAITRNAGGGLVNAAGVMTGRGGRIQRDDADYTTAQAEAVWRPTTGRIRHTVLLGVERNGVGIDTRRGTYTLPNVAIVGGQPQVLDVAPATPSSAGGFARTITSTGWSVYGQEQADVGARWKLRAGARLDRIELVDAGLFGTVAGRVAGTNDLLSWQAGLVYQPTPYVSLYGGYARGRFLSIQTESLSLSSAPARFAPPAPESSTQVEAGAKLDLARGVRLDVAAFETRRRDFFVTLVAGGDPVQLGAQRVRGVEADLVAALGPHVTVTANGAFVDAVNRSSALATVGTIAVDRASYGYALAATPRLSGAVWGEYRRGPLMLGLGVQAKDATYADALELLRVPGYAVVRAAAGYRIGGVEAQLTVGNLFNRRYYSVPTFIGALPGEPRTVQLTLRVRP